MDIIIVDCMCMKEKNFIDQSLMKTKINFLIYRPIKFNLLM
jgi:hypothetical protein